MKWLLAALLMFGASAANATTTNLSIVISSPASTSVSCPISYPSGQTSFVEPVSPGVLVAICTVAPAGWSGALALSGPDAASFALSGMNVVVGSNAISIAKTYNITITATP
jgi:hypothetical protein